MNAAEVKSEEVVRSQQLARAGKRARNLSYDTPFSSAMQGSVCSDLVLRNGKRVSRSGPKDKDDAKEEVLLPRDVIITILEKLPVVTQLLLRMAWREGNFSEARWWFPTLKERELSRAAAGAGEMMLWVVGCTSPDHSGSSRRSCIYDPATDRWYELHLQLRSLVSDVWLPEVSVSGGALVSAVWKGRSGRDWIPYVGNPLQRSWACLPPLPAAGGAHLDHVRGMLVDARSRSFKIVVMKDWVLRNVSDSIETFVFDSAVGRWDMTISTMDRRLELHDIAAQHGVFVGSVLYCLTRKGHVMAYDILERCRWRSLDASHPRQGAGPLCFVSSCHGPVYLRGRLLCLALMVPFRCRQKPRLHVQIWELDLDLDPARPRRDWTNVAAMPAAMLDSLFESELGLQGRRANGYELTQLESLGGIKVVAAHDQVYVMLGDKMVAVDLRETPAAWRWLPPYPYKQFGNKSLQCVDPWLQFASWPIQQS